MKDYVVLKNKDALEYNKAINKEIKDLCSPLLKFGIAYFCYVKFFNDGRRLYIFNAPWWVELYLKNNFQDDLDHLEHYAPQKAVRYSFWSGAKKDAVFDALYEHDIWHGFSIYENHKEYVESFEFSTIKENYKITDFYLNNIYFLEEFINDFKKKASHLIYKENKKNIIIPKRNIIVNQIIHTCSVEEEKIEKFKEEIGINFA